MRRGVSAVRVGFVTGAAALVTLGLAAPLMAQPAAGASAGSVRVTPRSLADDTVLGTFSSVGGGVDNAVEALAVDGDDSLYAGGYFTTAGGKAGLNRIAAWSNRDDTWHALGIGTNQRVSALALLGDDTVYAGGDFSAAGGVSGTNAIAASSIADGTWHALGIGMTGGFFPAAVVALAVQRDDTLYVAGAFNSASGVSATNGIAAWSNADDAWHSIGPGRPTAAVKALTLLGDDTLIAGGAFGDVGGLPGTLGIAAWSTRSGTWSAVGGGVTGGAGVQALAAQGDDTLYVGGQFTAAGGIAGTAKVAAWANADDTWHAIGGGTNDDVMALAFDDTHGLLYAGGAFSAAGTVTASRVAVWDTGISAWIPLQAAGGNGVVDQFVTALALDDSIVYLGGAFSRAGGGSGPAYLARWTWDAPSAEAVPATGAHGAAIQLRGSGLIGVTGVRVNGAAVAYTRDDSTTISLTIPGGLYDGSYPIAVDAVGGTATTSYTVTGSPAPTPPPVYPPGAPRLVTAVAGDASASVSWVAPSDSGSFPISTHQVTSVPGGKSCLVRAPALACEVSGLVNGTEYTFAVRALNGAGWGAESALSNAVTPRAVARPTIVITGSRDVGDPRLAVVRGITTDLLGEQVTPWIRFRGETSFSAGAGLRTVGSDGSFEWGRKTGRKLYVYFTHESVKSNTVVIPAR